MTVFVNGRAIEVVQGMTAAGAVVQAGAAARRSVDGEPRSAVCGMGICHECRARINGAPHERTCLVTCVEGMRIDTDD